MLDSPTSEPRGLTLAATVVAAIQSRIDARSLAPGARLPSVRGLAETMKVSKSTVVEAYDRLIAEGAIVARRGSGFYVAGPTRPLSLKALGPQLDRAIEQLVDLKLAISQGSGHLSAVLLHRLLSDGGHRRHLDGLRAKLSVAMGQAIRRLDALGLKPWVEPRGGLFLWARLPDGLDSADIARYGLKKNVVFAPGDVFSISRSAGGFLRFNVAMCGHPRIFEVLEEAMEAAARPDKASAGR
jgi:DNA-binding transcriptional MocR family regulator